MDHGWDTHIASGVQTHRAPVGLVPEWEVGCMPRGLLLGAGCVLLSGSSMRGAICCSSCLGGWRRGVKGEGGRRDLRFHLRVAGRGSSWPRCRRAGPVDASVHNGEGEEGTV